jgi:hypothetical protein
MAVLLCLLIASAHAGIAEDLQRDIAKLDRKYTAAKRKLLKSARKKYQAKMKVVMRKGDLDAAKQLEGKIKELDSMMTALTATETKAILALMNILPGCEISVNSEGLGEVYAARAFGEGYDVSARRTQSVGAIAGCTGIQTKKKYRVPLKVEATVSTDAKNLCLHFGKSASVLCKCDAHKPSNLAKAWSRHNVVDKVRLNANQLYKLVWVINKSSMTLTIDGKKCFEKKGDYSDKYDPLTIGTEHGSTVMIKSFRVRTNSSRN